MSYVKERKVSTTSWEASKRYHSDLRVDTKLGEEELIFWPTTGQMEFSYVNGGRMMGFRVLGTGYPPTFISTTKSYSPADANVAERRDIIERMNARQKKRPFEGLPEMIAKAVESAETGATDNLPGVKPIMKRG